jgi:hypothetical protein
LYASKYIFKPFIHLNLSQIAKLSERQLLKRKEIEGLSKPLTSNDKLTRSESGVSSHADLLEKHHREWAEKMASLKAQDDAEAEAQEFERYLTDRVIRHAIELEERARHLLIGQLPVGSKAGLLLKADRNLQLRDLKTLEEGDGDRDAPSESAGYIGTAPELDGLSTLEQVNAYRHTYAGLLAAASELKGLEGKFYSIEALVQCPVSTDLIKMFNLGVEKHRFERRRLKKQNGEVNFRLGDAAISINV